MSTSPRSTDPELLADMEHSRLLRDAAARDAGDPLPRARRREGVLRPWKSIFRAGEVEHSLKELCRVYVSKTIDCDY